MASSDRQQFSQ